MHRRVHDSAALDPDSAGSAAADPIGRPTRAPDGEGRFGPGHLLVIAAFAAMALGIWPFVSNLPQPDLLQLLRHTLLPGAMLVLVLLVAARHERRWKQSTRRLTRTLVEVRRGGAAMEELSDITHLGELADLAHEVRTLCHEHKTQKRLNRQLEAEMQHRIANRTDSLERMMASLRQKASRDALTGLGNRRAFDEVFGPMIEQARRRGTDLCVVMIDVDHFKHLNDTCGHPAGDEMLRQIGQLIRGAVRDRDEAFRYGGDEFVLVLTGTTAEAGRATAERLSRLVEDLSRQYRGKLSYLPRLSCGVADLAQMPAADAEDLLKLADEDCYRQKNARRAARAA